MLDDFKENAETCKKGQKGPVRCNITVCVGISEFWKRYQAGVASLSTVFMGMWLLILLQGRTRETALKKRQEQLSFDGLLPTEISVGQERHLFACFISVVTLNWWWSLSPQSWGPKASRKRTDFVLGDIFSHGLLPCRNSPQSHLNHLNQVFPADLIYFDLSKAQHNLLNGVYHMLFCFQS